MTGRPLSSWLNEPSSTTGVRHLAANGRWDFSTYEEIAARCHLLAGGLIRAGVRRNDRVVVIVHTGPDFLAAFFGTMLTGATVSVVAPPLGMQDGAAYAAHVSSALVALDPVIVIADRSMRAHLAVVSPLTVPLLTPDELAADGVPGRDAGRRQADIALVQFTSGTGGRQRGVRISPESLAANTAAIRTWLRAGPTDEWASWLPVHHDMGLIGCLVTPVVGGNTVWLQRPEEFVRDPMTYLRCFGAAGATITATPGFGLEQVLRRVRPGDLDGLDFTGWRAIVVGAERVDPDTLRRFHYLLAPRGLARSALLPAYGLAEATLAVTGVGVGHGWRGIDVRADLLTTGERVATAAGGRRQTVVGCGRPLPGMSVRVIDESGASLAPGRLGEIEVRGTSVAEGYLDDDAATSTIESGALRTGDAGFLVDGELYVLGRLGDGVKVRGRSIFAEDVEQLLRKTGAAPHRQAVVLGERFGEPVAVAVLEEPAQDVLSATRQLLRSGAAGAATVVIAAPAGTIPRTSSGKRRRGELWRAFIAGEFDDLAITGTFPRTTTTRGNS